ncbi:hypothetical protein L6R53_01505 [Myxococcota bacterium]|nr:hypothetical protein [Myxococcota bacterium]
MAATLPALGLLLLTGCQDADHPLAQVDDRYVDILVDLGVANRDTARNVRSTEARARKAEAEERQAAFFRDPQVQAVIEQVRASPPTPIEKAKAEGYWRQMITSRPWTEGEKAEEVRLLGRLEEQASVPATWKRPDGSLEVDLAPAWTEVSRAANGWPQAERDALLAALVEQQLQVVGADLRALIKLRNEVARREGFEDWWSLGLASQGLTPAEVDDLITSLTEVVRPHHHAVAARLEQTATATGIPLTAANLPLLRRRAGLELGQEEADGWFDADLAEDRVLTAFRDMGIDTWGWQVYTEPRRYARPGVYGFPIRPPEHLAIVLSQDRRWSTWQYEALAHEGGHAAWWRMLSTIQASSPTLWSPPDPWFEGFAQLFERILYEPAFLSAYVPEVPPERREGLSAWRAAKAVAAISDAIVQTQVERRLYQDPEDLVAVAAFASQTRAALTLEPAPPASSSGLPYDPALLSSLLWNYPAYSQNFMVAALAEAWLYEAVAEHVGDPVGNPKVGPLLQERIVRAQADLSFPDRVAALTAQDQRAALSRYLARGALPAAAHAPPATVGE